MMTSQCHSDVINNVISFGPDKAIFHAREEHLFLRSKKLSCCAYNLSSAERDRLASAMIKLQLSDQFSEDFCDRTDTRTDNKTLLDFPTPIHLLVLGETK